MARGPSVPAGAVKGHNGGGCGHRGGSESGHRGGSESGHRGSSESGHRGGGGSGHWGGNEGNRGSGVLRQCTGCDRGRCGYWRVGRVFQPERCRGHGGGGGHRGGSGSGLRGGSEGNRGSGVLRQASNMDFIGGEARGGANGVVKGILWCSLQTMANI